MDKELKLIIFMKFCKGIGIDISDETIEVDDSDGSIIFGNKEYLVFTDEEADNECKERILEDLWAFRASYIIKYMKLHMI